MVQIVGSDQIITADKARAERCLKEIQGTLRAHNCQLVPFTVIAAGRITQHGYNIVPLPNVPKDLKGGPGGPS